MINKDLFSCICCRFLRSLLRSFAAPQGVRFGQYKQRWLNPSCWAIGVSGNEAENLFDDQTSSGIENGSLLGALDESSSAPFGTVDAEITPETIDFFVSDAEGDPDCPSEGYTSIDQALNTLRQGKVATYAHMYSTILFIKSVRQYSEGFLAEFLICYKLFLGKKKKSYCRMLQIQK